MLSTPEHGWATVEIGGVKLDVSHIQPVPEMLLTAFIRALSTGSAAEATFDAEGSTWRMEAGAQTRLTLMGKTTETYTVPISADVLARQALADIRHDLDTWSRWNPGEPEALQRATLTRLCTQLERLLKE